MKKNVLSLVVVLALCFAAALPAFAEETGGACPETEENLPVTCEYINGLTGEGN